MSHPFTSLRRWSLAALLTNVMIIVTGGAVRVTGSGLGCPEWPACEGGAVVPSAGAEAGWRQLVEFGNRLLSFVVLAAVVGAWFAARRALEERAVERRLAGWLVVGVLAQAVLGGITVRLGLHWATVTSHFLLSMVLVGVAALLHLKVATGRFGADEPRVPLARWIPMAGGAVLVIGTLVTAAGPHAGDPGTGRLGLAISAVARTHGVAVWITVGLTIAVLVAARRVGAVVTARAAGLLLAVEVVQGGVGYWQYFNGVPARLVLVHMLLAAVFWIAAVRVGAIGAAQRPEARVRTPDLAV